MAFSSASSRVALIGCLVELMPKNLFSLYGIYNNILSFKSLYLEISILFYVFASFISKVERRNFPFYCCNGGEWLMRVLKPIVLFV